jgi:uncharacterized membrane protein
MYFLLFIRVYNGINTRRGIHHNYTITLLESWRIYMENKLTRKLVLSGLFAALICVVTLVAKFPVPGATGAYVNAGDGVIYAAAIVMSGPWAALAAGVGSMFSDLLAGAAVYAPATLVVKAAMGLIVSAALFGRKASVSRYIIFMALGSLVMVAGYGIYEFFVFGYAVMLGNLSFDLIQAVGGVIIGLLLALLVRRITPENWVDAFKGKDGVK